MTFNWLFACKTRQADIIVVDYTEQKKLAAEINKIGVNINTVCRRINSTGRFYQDDIDELKEKMDAVWQLLKWCAPRQEDNEINQPKMSQAAFK